MAKHAITALFDHYDEAAKALGKVEAEGVPHSDIAIVSSRDSERRAGAAAGGDTGRASVAPDHDATTSTGAGAAFGGALGGGAGLLAGLGLIAIPGTGPVLAAGWLVATLTGASIGAASGGLLGALTGAGLSHADAEAYAEGLRRGGTLLTVLAEGAIADRVADILKRSGSIDLDDRARDWRALGWTGGTAGIERAPATALEIRADMEASPAEDEPGVDDPTAVEHPSRRLPEAIR